MDGEPPQSDVTGAVVVNMQFLNRGLYSLPRRVTKQNSVSFCDPSQSVRQDNPAVKCLVCMLYVQA